MNHAAPAISLVVAMDENGCIGRAGGLPWHLPADLRRFRELTWGKPILMGRRTHESIGRPLPGRLNIVVTRSPAYKPPGVEVVHSLAAAFAAAGEVPEIMVIGGATLYADTLPGATRLYLTEVHARVAGDTWFPAFDRGLWREIARAAHPATARDPWPFSFLVLERNP